MAGSDKAAAGGHNQLAALEQLDSHVIHVGAQHIPGAAHADVIGRVGAVAAGAVSAEQVVPAVAIEQIGGFHVDGDVYRLVAGDPFSRFGIELDHTDEAEVGRIPEL